MYGMTGHFSKTKNHLGFLRNVLFAKSILYLIATKLDNPKKQLMHHHVLYKFN